MRSKANIFGHSIHQMLVVFPMGLLMATIIFDIIRGISGNPIWSHSAWWMMAVGGLLGLVAAVFGAIDWLAIPDASRAKKVGVYHAGANVFALLLFLVSWLLRIPNPGTPSALAIIFSAVGVGVLLVSGWLGGELLNRLGVGVEEGAHVDAPSSLRSRIGLHRRPIEER